MKKIIITDLYHQWDLNAELFLKVTSCLDIPLPFVSMDERRGAHTLSIYKYYFMQDSFFMKSCKV